MSSASSRKRKNLQGGIENKSKKPEISSDIDDIFGTVKKTHSVEETGKKNTKPDENRTEKEKQKAKQNLKTKVDAPQRNEDERSSKGNIKGSSLPHGIVKSNVPRVIISPDPPVERIDPETGYKVYKAHLLKVGEGGGTPLCIHITKALFIWTGADETIRY
jgi:hypothetical protein